MRYVLDASPAARVDAMIGERESFMNSREHRGKGVRLSQWRQRAIAREDSNMRHGEPRT
jgi:hypothetical protein